jgi:4-coumarate--CoA ligase
MAAHIYSSTYPEVEIPSAISISEFIATYNPNSVANDKVINTDTLTGKSLTYAGLRFEASRCAYGLRHTLGLEIQSTLLIICPNATDYLLLAHSVWWAGAALASINPNGTSADFTHALRLVRPSHVCVYPPYLPTVREAISASGLAIKLVTIVDREDGIPHFPDDMDSAKQLPVFRLTEHGLDAATTTAWIGMSSGTTSSPRAVAHSHRSLIANVLTYRASHPDVINSSSREVFFPMYAHVYGVICVMLCGAALGNFTCGMHKFDLEEFCRLCDEHNATWAHLVPPVAIGLVASEAGRKYELKSLKTLIIAAAPTGADLAKRIKTRLGSDCKILQAYGMTECPLVSHSGVADADELLGSVGIPLAGTEIRLVDPATGEDVPDGATGELWLRSARSMSGYVNEKLSESTAFSADGAWLRTGDVIRRDRHGALWVIDRLKEMIKYRGMQVAPSELEDLLLGHDAVVDAAVGRSRRHEEGNEVPVAFVSLEPASLDLSAAEKQALLDQIRAWADAQLADHKRLRGGVLHLQQLPKSPAGKILRRLLPV